MRVYAVRYGHREARRREHFHGGDPRDGPMAMDYFLWAVRDDDGRALVIDTGMTEATARPQRREIVAD